MNGADGRSFDYSKSKSYEIRDSDLVQSPISVVMSCIKYMDRPILIEQFELNGLDLLNARLCQMATAQNLNPEISGFGNW